MKYSTLLTVSAILAIATGAVINAHATDTTVASIDNPNGPVIVAAGDTLTVTGNVTSTGDSTSTRFDKQGAGTLVLQGDNTFKRIKHTAGKLVFDGGATTVSGGTGSGNGDSANILLEGDETIVTGGGSFTIGTGSQYAKFRSMSTVITNGTMDVTGLTGEMLCNSNDGGTPTVLGQGIITIGAGGKLRAKSMRPHQQAGAAYKDKYGVRIVDGGILEITGANGIKLDGAHYGFVNFNGGVLVNSYNSDNNNLPYVVNTGKGSVIAQWANSPVTIGEKGAVISNATTKALNWQVPFKAGAASDGGLHLAGKGYLFLKADGSTFNGGLFLDSNEGLLVAPEYDGTLGAVPAVPSDNIFVRGSSNLILARIDLDLDANRNILVSSNRTFSVLANTGRAMTIHGEINGQHEPGALPLTTRMSATYKWDPLNNKWKGGNTVLDPGEGRTNNVGRLYVDGNLEIRSGVTLVSSPVNSINEDSALLVRGPGVVANNQLTGEADSSIATLKVSGGKLAVAPNSTGKFIYVDNFGVVDICGGKVSNPSGHYLNAMWAGQTIIRDGGVLDCDTFRPAQYMTNNPVVLRLEANGLLSARQLWIDSGANKTNIATVVFNGGAMQTKRSDNKSFVDSPTSAAWNRITFAVGPGGAVFDVSNGVNLWWYRPLVSGVAAGESDGGLTVRGAKDWAVCIMVPQSYNGPTTVDRCTLQQRGGDNQLPVGTKLVLKNNGYVIFNKFDSANTPTEASFSGITGDGRLERCQKVSVGGALAPSIGGTIEFRQSPQSLSGPIEIVGDATGCGKVKFDVAQDLSTLSLVVTDAENLDKNADKGLYQIVEGNYVGRFKSVAGLPDDWAVSYRASGVYLSHIDAFTLIVR